MLLAVAAAFIIVVWAALVNIESSFHPLHEMQFLSAVVLTLAVSLQRITSVQKWLSRPMSSRKRNVEVLAEQTLINLCRDQAISNDLLDLRVHVWEVPLWYRRIFPYRLRVLAKRIAVMVSPMKSTKLTIRPTLRRLAAVGLVKQPPSGVSFRKGVSIIGVCIANNDRAEFLTLDISDEMRRNALSSTTEQEWLGYGPELTHNLKLVDAQKLSHSYGQVVAKVVQNIETGEAIGCVTISAKNCTTDVLRVTTNKLVKESIATLALSVAPLLT